MIPTSIATAQIELRLDGESPRGVLTGADGLARHFSGWMELAAAIEDWRTTTPAARGRDRERR